MIRFACFTKKSNRIIKKFKFCIFIKISKIIFEKYEGIVQVKLCNQMDVYLSAYKTCFDINVCTYGKQEKYFTTINLSILNVTIICKIKTYIHFL